MKLKQKFSIRKLSVGVCSVVVGALLAGNVTTFAEENDSESTVTTEESIAESLEKLDYTSLEAFAERVLALDSTKYTEESYNALYSAVDHIDMLALKTQSDVSALVARLESLFNALVLKESVETTTATESVALNLEALEALGERIEALDSTKYTEESYNALYGAMSDIDILSLKAQSDVDALTSRLEVLFNALVPTEGGTATAPVALNYAKLDAAMARLRKIDRSKYTDESFKAIVKLSERFDAATLKTQADVDAEAARWQKAMDELVLKTTVPVTKPEVTGTQAEEVVEEYSPFAYVREYVKRGDEKVSLESVENLYLDIEELEKDSPIAHQLHKFGAFLTKKSGKTITIQQGGEPQEGEKNVIRTLKDETLPEEGYHIDFADVITIKYKTLTGLNYALLTLQQAVLRGEEVHHGYINDYPSVTERGFMLDMARKFYSKDWIIKLIDQLSLERFNRLQLHFSENEGFRIQSEKHPEIVSDEHLTKDEIREIIAHAKKNFIEIIPDFDSPGHLRKVLEKHKEFQLPGGEGKALDVTNPKAVEFMKSIIKEYAELFADSKVFHIGGDETINFNNIRKFPTLREAAQKKYGEQASGIETLIDYTNDIAEYVKGLGFEPRVWSDPYYRLNLREKSSLSKDVAVTYWTHWDGPMAPVSKFLEEGHKLINFNDAYMYYVLGEAAGYKYPTGRKIYEGFTPGKFPGKNRTQGGGPQEIAYPEYKDLLGSYFAIWSDRPRAQTEEQVFNGIFEPIKATGFRTWNPFPTVSRNYKTFLKDNLELVPQVYETAQLDKVVFKKYEAPKLVLDNLEVAKKYVLSLNKGEYTEESYNALYVLAIESDFSQLKTQQDVDNLVEKINEKIAALESAVVEKVPSAAPTIDLPVAKLPTTPTEETADKEKMPSTNEKDAKPKAVVQQSSAKPKGQALPETGEESLALFGVAAMSILAGVGLVTARRREEN